MLLLQCLVRAGWVGAAQNTYHAPVPIHLLPGLDCSSRKAQINILLYKQDTLTSLVFLDQLWQRRRAILPKELLAYSIIQDHPSNKGGAIHGYSSIICLL